ncbi:PREDICTED: S-locus-specific glycoprotein S6-like [Ipomoea nil]|uniref:S-locus-specific glycoprotein S6-like n=1 Tax=Ipomoea nil TaxID=35883 RepID=UPI000900F1CD|nr:PREDICTED: S-locus-specific glycoprotein S6-like [Ipomoea nil]
MAMAINIPSTLDSNGGFQLPMQCLDQRGVVDEIGVATRLDYFGRKIGDRRETPWQSFDYPTNTLLPHMKVGVDKKTGWSRFLSAWKSADDPGREEYVVILDLKGVLIVKWSGIPEMTPNINSYNYFDNDDEVTMSY